MTRINTNVSSLIAQNNLANSNNSLQTALTRLSTGLQINTGADNPSGLIASEALGADITAVNAGITNSQLANSIISTADSALGQVSILLNSIRGLVSQSANTGALSSDQVAANQLQVDSSLQAIDRIAQTTTFQGRRLLDGSLDFITTSAGNVTTAAAGTIGSTVGAKATLTLGSGTSAVTYTAASNGAAGNAITVAYTTGATAGSEVAAFNGTTHVLSVQIATGASTATQVAAAVAANGSAAAALNVTATGSGTEVHTSATNLAGGTDDNVVTITAANGGTAYNGLAVNLVTGATQGSETATYNTGTNTLTVNIADASTSSQIATAIGGVSGGLFTATAAGNGAGAIGAATLTDVLTGGTSNSNISNLQINQANFGTQTAVNVAVNVDAQATQGSLTYAGGTLTSALVLQIGGSSGFNVFNFGTGTTNAQISTAINAVSDATGVKAMVNGSNLVLTSSNYGSSAFVSAKALSGTFGTVDSTSAAATRSTGTDVQVRVNGIKATGDGLKASIDTPTLNLSFSVSSSLANNASFNFAITGGGANFQLGPDVVSNQQARLGIQGVNTATLGGIDGTLYQLQSGGSKALATDPSGAAAIVDEVINQVTTLRGRLGAFQSTTLNTNIASLQNTLSNLTSAQSTIKDANFAVESANLTRAQILVQSGISVLSVANKNPENVLKLLQ